MTLHEDIAVIATDPQGVVTVWNRAAQRLYGWRTPEALGRSIMDLTPAQQSRAQAAEIMAALQAGETWEGENILRTKDGRPLRAYVLDFPVADAAGASGAIVGFSTTAENRGLLADNLSAIEAKLATWASGAA